MKKKEAVQSSSQPQNPRDIIVACAMVVIACCAMLTYLSGKLEAVGLPVLTWLTYSLIVALGILAIWLIIKGEIPSRKKSENEDKTSDESNVDESKTKDSH